MQRRSLLKKMGGLLLAPALPYSRLLSKESPALRIAHLTDIHLKNDFGAPQHLRDCLHHVQQQTPKVDFILNGGDIVFDMNKEELPTIRNQWQLLHSVMSAECSLPVHYVLGNHDIWWQEQNKTQALLCQLLRS